MSKGLFTAISTSAGLLSAAIMMWAAWQHNSQCEIQCDGVIYWGYWFLIGGSWFIAGFVAAFLLLIAANQLISIFNLRPSA